MPKRDCLNSSGLQIKFITKAAEGLGAIRLDFRAKATFIASEDPVMFGCD